MRALAKLYSNDPNADPQTIEFGYEGENDGTIKAVLTGKSGRKQTKSYPINFNVESTIIDMLSEHSTDGYIQVLFSDDLKKYRISWMVTPSSQQEIEYMVQVLNALSGTYIDPDPSVLMSQVVVCQGLPFAISNFANDCNVSVSFWSNRLTDEQAACLTCFGKLKVQMTDEAGNPVPTDNQLKDAIRTQARKAYLGESIDAELLELGAAYKPVDFAKIADTQASAMIDF